MVAHHPILHCNPLLSPRASVPLSHYVFSYSTLPYSPSTHNFSMPYPPGASTGTTMTPWETASHSKNYASTAYSGSSPDIVTGRVQGPKLIPSCTSYCCTTPVPHSEIPEINAREGVANRPLDIKAPVKVGSFSDPEHSGHSTGYPGSIKYLPSWNTAPKTPKKGSKNVHSGIGALQDSLEAPPPSYARLQCDPENYPIVPMKVEKNKEYIDEGEPPFFISKDSPAPYEHSRAVPSPITMESSPPPEMQSSRFLGYLKRIRGYTSPWAFGGEPLNDSIPRIPPPCAFCHSRKHGYLTCGRYYLLFHGKCHAEFRRPRKSDCVLQDIVDCVPIVMKRPSSMPKFVSHLQWVWYIRTLADYHCNPLALQDGRDGHHYIEPPMNKAPNGLGMITLPLRVGGVPMVALVDIGSSLSFISSSLFGTHRLLLEPYLRAHHNRSSEKFQGPSNNEVQMADGQRMHATRYLDAIPLQYHSLSTSHDLTLLPLSTDLDVILGLDFLNAHRASMTLGDTSGRPRLILRAKDESIPSWLHHPLDNESDPALGFSYVKAQTLPPPSHHKRCPCPPLLCTLHSKPNWPQVLEARHALQVDDDSTFASLYQQCLPRFRRPLASLGFVKSNGGETGFNSLLST